MCAQVATLQPAGRVFTIWPFCPFWKMTKTSFVPLFFVHDCSYLFGFAKEIFQNKILYLRVSQIIYKEFRFTWADFCFNSNCCSFTTASSSSTCIDLSFNSTSFIFTSSWLIASILKKNTHTLIELGAFFFQLIPEGSCISIFRLQTYQGEFWIDVFYSRLYGT